MLAERAPYHFTHNEAHSPTQEARGDNHAAKRRHSGATQAVALFRNRVLPLLFAGYLLNFLDRTNISYAQLQMGADLDISLAAYGLGAGLFFFGYASVCVPANLALQRFGVRRWLAFMFLAWGLVSCLMAALQGVKSFYVLRFLLGVAEGGFIPP